MKPLRKKLQRCRDPDRADLVALQRARREQATAKPKNPTKGNDGAVFGDAEPRDPKRRKVDNTDDMFGPALGQ
jgi:cyclin H